MTVATTHNLQTFLDDLQSADLVGISFLPQSLGLRLDFTFGPESEDVAIELYHIVHLVLSQSLNFDDNDLCFWVGEVTLQKLEEDPLQVLSDLSYFFQSDRQNLTEDSALLSFSLEGDLCLKAICTSYKVFQEIQ